MELFKTDGHLTDEGLQAVLNGGLDEMQRLEASEHLGFCTPCLERYTALLGDDVLLTPAAPLQKPVMRRVRSRGGKARWLQYGTIAAAACLALLMWWGIGATGLPQGSGQRHVQPPAATEPAATEPTTPKEDGLIARVREGLGNFWGTLLGAQPDTQTATPPQAPQPTPPAAPAPQPPAATTPTLPASVAPQTTPRQPMSREERDRLFDSRAGQQPQTNKTPATDGNNDDSTP